MTLAAFLDAFLGNYITWWRWYLTLATFVILCTWALVDARRVREEQEKRFQLRLEQMNQEKWPCPVCGSARWRSTIGQVECGQCGYVFTPDVLSLDLRGDAASVMV